MSIEQVDALRTLLEPVAGVVDHDDTGAEPFTYEPNTLYGWDRRIVYKQTGTGQQDEEHFAIRLAYVADSADEVDAGVRLRSVSTLLSTKYKAYAAIVRANRTVDGLWENLQVDAVDWDALRAIGVRGFFFDVSGYQLLE